MRCTESEALRLVNVLPAGRKHRLESTAPAGDDCQTNVRVPYARESDHVSRISQKIHELHFLSHTLSLTAPP